MLLHDLKRLAVLRPDDAVARFELGEALFADQQYDAAVKQLEKALSLDPDHANARRVLARAYREDGRMTLSERTLEEAVRRRPDDPGARDELAELYVHGGRIDDAIVELEEAVRVAPGDVSRRLLVADLSRRRGLLARARRHLEQARLVAPEDRGVSMRLHELALELGESGPAHASPIHRGKDFLLGRMREALDRPPLSEITSAGAMHDAAVLLRRMDVQGAKRALVIAPETERESEGFAILRAEMTLAEGDLANAETAYRRAASKAPRSAFAWSRLGEILFAGGRFDDALHCIETWVALAPDDAGAHDALADALAALGRKDGAEAEYRRSLGLQSDGVVAAKLAELRASERRAEDLARPVGRIGALGWSATGGVVSTLEALAIAGKGELIFTGTIGKTGQDAAKVAFSCLKARAESLGIEEAVRTLDLHYHFVDTELKKDGPSAGLALALAGISAYTRRPLKPNLAATGEITLQGAVRAVAGLHEKLVASYLAGVEIVLVPRKNLFEIRALSKDVVSRLRLVYVDSLAEALGHALLDGDGSTTT